MKQYVGSAVNISKRLEQHKNGFRSSRHLQNAIQKYGIENFKFEVLEECSPEDNIATENYFIKLFRPEYNIAPQAGSVLGYKFNAKQKAKRSAMLKGNSYKKGCKLSEETKAKISASNIGKKRTDETKTKLSIAGTGHRHTEKSKAKMSAKRIGKKLSKETKAKMSIARIGNKNALGSKSTLGYKHTTKAKEIMSAARKAWWIKRKAER